MGMNFKGRTSSPSWANGAHIFVSPTIANSEDDLKKEVEVRQLGKGHVIFSGDLKGVEEALNDCLNGLKIFPQASFELWPLKPHLTKLASETRKVYSYGDLPASHLKKVCAADKDNETHVVWDGQKSLGSQANFTRPARPETPRGSQDQNAPRRLARQTHEASFWDLVKLRNGVRTGTAAPTARVESALASRMAIHSSSPLAALLSVASSTLRHLQQVLFGSSTPKVRRKCTPFGGGYIDELPAARVMHHFRPPREVAHEAVDFFRVNQRACGTWLDAPRTRPDSKRPGDPRPQHYKGNTKKQHRGGQRTKKRHKRR